MEDEDHEDGEAAETIERGVAAGFGDGEGGGRSRLRGAFGRGDRSNLRRRPLGSA